jgi:dihydroorotate dehydrogenase (NAD+) catalytic subunit
MVWQAANAVSLPIIGIGGIATAEHALEFILAGASAVQVGSASFTRPDSMLRVVDGIDAWLEEQDARVSELVGTLKVGPAQHELAGSAGY